MIETSILDSVKNFLPLPPDCNHFDEPIINAINTVFADLWELGIGPSEGFEIHDNTTLWSDYITDKRINSIISYVQLRTKLIFDPPTSSTIVNSFERQLARLEFNLNIAVDPDHNFYEEGNSK